MNILIFLLTIIFNVSLIPSSLEEIFEVDFGVFIKENDKDPARAIIQKMVKNVIFDAFLIRIPANAKLKN
jgi:peptidoglycan biosynthesis protein MviN/MurJ (putative lipid II flippase)